MKKTGKSTTGRKKSAKPGGPQNREPANPAAQESQPATQGQTAPTMADVEPKPAGRAQGAAGAKKNSKAARQPSEPKKKGTTVTGHEPVNTPAGGQNGRMVVTPEQRWLMIAEAAYYKAEQRGFSTEGSEHDWYEAEKEICAHYRTPEEQ